MEFATNAHKKVWMVLQLIQDQITIFQHSKIMAFGQEQFKGKEVTFGETLAILDQLQKAGVVAIKKKHGRDAWMGYPDEEFVGTEIVAVEFATDETKLEKYLDDFNNKHALQTFVVKKNNQLQLVLFSDHFLCKADNPDKGQCYLFRTRRGKRSHRLAWLETMAANPTNYLGSEALARLTGSKPKTVNTEIKAMFEAIADKLDVQVKELYDSNNNGYRLVCGIKIVNRPLIAG